LKLTLFCGIGRNNVLPQLFNGIFINFFSMAIHETAHIVAAAVQKRILVSVRITALGLNAVIKENMMLMQIVF